MKNTLALGFVIACLVACSGLEQTSDDNQRSSNEAPDHTGTGKEPAAATKEIEKATVKTSDGDGAGNLLDKFEFRGPQPIYLAPEALKMVYGRVFNPAAPRGTKTTGYFATNPREIFTPEQKVVMGEFNVVATNGAHLRSFWVDDNNQNYQKNLREFLGDACNNLVNVEHGRLPAPDYTDASGTNVLVKRRGAPTTAEIGAFMTKLYGYAPVDGAVHAGAAEYRKAFADGLAEKAEINPGMDQQLYIKELYRALCIAIGNDPRVYLR